MLYGRAIYSSSVLIAVLWISVIFQLFLAYWLLYRTQVSLERGGKAWIPALISLLVVLSIGQIYAMNMTLMLRPDAWPGMSANSPEGLQAVSGDPTMTPRFMFVIAGGLVFGGMWALVHSTMRHLDDATKAALAQSGGWMAAGGAVLQLLFGYLAVARQPEAVRSGIGDLAIWKISMLLCVAGLLVAALVGALQAAKSKATFLLSLVGAVFAFLGNAGAVIVRDGIRDLTLQGQGFNVWDRTEASNWSVIVAFLLLFVIMLGVIVWLLSVMRKATPPQEAVTL